MVDHGLNRTAAFATRVGIACAWNHHWHMECFYALPGVGAVCHTINPRLFEEQIVYIINHAKDRVLVIDQDFVGMVEGIADRLPHVEQYVIMGSEGCVPGPTQLGDVLYYDDIIAGEATEIAWPQFDERTIGTLLYLGYHRKPQGCVVRPPFNGAALHGDCPARQFIPLGP